MTTKIALSAKEPAVCGIGQPGCSATAATHSGQPMQKLSYTVGESIVALSIGKTTLYKLISEGRLKVVKIGARTLIPASELQALIVPTVG